MTGMEFVYVTGDCYEMGCGSGASDCESDEKPVHTVCVDDFYMGKHEVTVAQYMRFAKETGSHYPEGMERGSEYNIKTGSNGHYKKLGNALSSDNYPVVGVSWKDATSFAEWLSGKTGHAFRLPSETEWEYATRSGGKKSLSVYLFTFCARQKCVFGHDSSLGTTRMVYKKDWPCISFGLKKSFRASCVSIPLVSGKTQNVKQSGWNFCPVFGRQPLSSL